MHIRSSYQIFSDKIPCYYDLNYFPKSSKQPCPLKLPIEKRFRILNKTERDSQIQKIKKNRSFASSMGTEEGREFFSKHQRQIKYSKLMEKERYKITKDLIDQEITNEIKEDDFTTENLYKLILVRNCQFSSLAKRCCQFEKRSTDLFRQWCYSWIHDFWFETV